MDIIVLVIRILQAHNKIVKGDAQQQAADALGLHLYGMEKDGDVIPSPSETPQIDPETSAGYLVSPVTVFPDIIRMELDTKAVKTNLTIPAWLKTTLPAGKRHTKVAV